MRGLLLSIVVAGLLNGSMAAIPRTDREGVESLAGKLLVAKPELLDPNFRRTVIFMVRHDATGALGLVVNRVAGSTEYSALLEDLGVEPEGVEGTVSIHYGGPVGPKRAFVLHSSEYSVPSSIHVNDRYAVTMNAEILKAMARGKGPKRALFAVGYAGWSAGQLEGELARGGWVVAPADREIVFGDDYPTKWKRAFESRFLSS